MLSCKHLPDLSTHSHLTKLNLANLNLTKIDVFLFEQYPQLRSLDLSHNQLVLINPDWARSSNNSIEDLNLSHNKLDTLLFLKDLRSLRRLNITENLLPNNERFLSLYICPTIEHLIDFDQEQIHGDQVKLDQLLRLIQRNLDQQNAHCRQSIIKIIEKQKMFSQFHLSPLGNLSIEQMMNQYSSPRKTSLTEQFNFSMKITEKANGLFEPIQFFRAHQRSNEDLTNISVHMCAFEPNSSKNILATCGGQKVCFIDCDRCEITHLFEVSTLRSTVGPTNQKIKDKNRSTNEEYFSCLCWMDIDNLKILAVGATNGSIYLISATWKLMFGHIELPGSSISCLTWHSDSAYRLVVGSYHTVRMINIRSYIDRLQSFIRKQNKPSTQFDYDDCSMFIQKVPTTHIYNLYNGDGPLMLITDLLFYPLSSENIVLLVGTSAGLFLIKDSDQSPIQLPFPKYIWTVSEYVESLRVINPSSHLIAMNLLHHDQIYCFNLKQSLQTHYLQITFTLSNPPRHVPTKLAIFSPTDNCENFQCIIGSNHGSFSYHQLQCSTEISLPEMRTTQPSSILSANLNEHYLSLTASNNLICIYKRC